MKSHFVISCLGGPRRATPYAFIEKGAPMLSTVLRSERAVQANIAITRAFVKLRELPVLNRDQARRLDKLEKNRTPDSE